MVSVGGRNWMEAPMPTIEAGQPVPDFTLPRDGGGTLGPKDFAGRALVIYFYPKDDTPGCTTEALEFTARSAEFEAAGAAVIGISKDSIKSHEKFCKKHRLAIPLLSDETGEVVERFGVWVEKSRSMPSSISRSFSAMAPT